MAALDDNRSGAGERNRVTNLRYSGSQSTKVVYWSDEANIAFPIKIGRMQLVQEPDKEGVTDTFQGSKYSSPRLNHGNPYSSGNMCPIDPHKWKGNGFSWNNKCWFRKANHLVSKGPRNWYPLPKPNTFDVLLKRDIPYTDSFLAPLTDHGNFQKWNGRFRQGNSKANQARFWRSNFHPINRNPRPNLERRLDFRRAGSLSQRPRFHKPVSKTSRPTIFLDENKINSSRSNLLESCIFIKWDGGKQVKDNFESWCRAQWGKDININILPNDFYMIEFMSNKEQWQAKNRGPYILDGIEVHIIDWQPNFNPQTYVLPDSKEINFSLDHTGISCDVSATIQRNYSYMQSPIEDKLQPKPLITDDSEDALCNDTLEKENVTLTEATPLIIVPPPLVKARANKIFSHY
ncbi:hypothetical protein SUGI_0084720 [Cryptomeria japonica]|nr:hypothetical protein SUGI_0084720 [Cryptomeria japonica]